MSSKYNWVFLSYTMSPSLSGYGNGKRIEITSVRSQKKGDSSNNTEIDFPSHYGTHIDFPQHFSLEGRSINNYNANDFIFKSVAIIDMQNISISDYLIKVDDLKKVIFQNKKEIDLIFIKTGFCKIRNSDDYWQQGLGFDLGTARFFKSIFPNLKAIGFDLISLSSFQKREIGRKAHAEFLLENDLLIIEDVDLRKVTNKTEINELIIAPLRFQNAEGTPVTILTQIKND